MGSKDGRSEPPLQMVSKSGEMLPLGASGNFCPAGWCVRETGMCCVGFSERLLIARISHAHVAGCCTVFLQSDVRVQDPTSKQVGGTGDGGCARGKGAHAPKAPCNRSDTRPGSGPVGVDGRSRGLWRLATPILYLAPPAGGLVAALQGHALQVSGQAMQQVSGCTLTVAQGGCEPSSALS